MKQLSLVVFFAIALLMGGTLKAQPSLPLEIVEASDSVWYTPCPAPQTIEMYMYGNASGYNPQDLITIQVYFGDGTDTSFTTPVQQSFIPSFFAWFQHTYQYAGQYTVMYIATGPDNYADTLIHPNEVLIGDTCGNISGVVYIDENSNCQFDQGESPLAYGAVSLSTGGNIVDWAYTNANGEYYFDAPIGQQYNLNFSVNGNSQGIIPTCPNSGDIFVGSVPSAGNDFGVECENGFDLTPYVSGWGFRPGFAAQISVCPRNLHCLPTSGELMLVLNDPLIDYTGAVPPPDNVSGDTLFWDFTNISNLTYFGNCITVHVNTDTAAQIGDEVCVEALISPVVGDADPSNNMVSECYPVQNSWDPNDKAVSPSGAGSNGAVLNNLTMTYRVRFQNTGTAPAVNIFILDTLDDNLDINTFQVLTASHDMVTSILPGNILKFTFNDIWLADSVSNEPESHGFVSYKIAQKPDLVDGAQFENTAHIYFDYNPAVVTNTVLNTIDLSLSVEENGVAVPVNVSIWPNPAQDHINVQVDRSLSGAGLQLVDMTGRVVQAASITGLQTQLQTSDLPAGAYMLVLQYGDNELVRKKVVLVK